MTTLLLCLIPVLLMPWIARLIFPHKIQWLEMLIILVIGTAITAGVYEAGIFSATADVEILNGEVIKKTREHDSYTRTYDCMCTTSRDSKGNSTTSCQTCHEEHYTVEWTVYSNVGAFQIDKKDSTWRSVYDSPDPTFYTNAKRGDPVAREHLFTNYVKAAPDSLVHAWDVKKYEKMIPDYPNRTFNFYNINRTLSAGVTVPDVAEWNKDISNVLKTLGPKCQANVIVVFTNLDQSYMQALEGKWVGGKKNDIIVVIGTSAYPKIDWVGVSSWTKAEMFKVKLRDDIQALGVVDRAQIIKAIETNTLTSFKRREMKDFEYLRYQIEPPTWVLILSIILGIIASLGLSWYFYNIDLGSVVRYTRPRRFR